MATGRRTLRFDAMTLGARETVRVEYVVRVGSGVGLGEHTNRVVALQNGVAVGNTASASVQRVLDPRPLSEAELAEPFKACDSEDYREGIRAFLAKETPAFRGR